MMVNNLSSYVHDITIIFEPKILIMVKAIILSQSLHYVPDVMELIVL